MKLRKMSDSNEFFVFENQHDLEFQVYTMRNVTENELRAKNAGQDSALVSQLKSKFKEKHFTDKRKFHKTMLNNHFMFVQHSTINFSHCHIINASSKEEFFIKACHLMDNNVLDLKVNDQGIVVLTYPYDDHPENSKLRVNIAIVDKDHHNELDEEL